MRCGVCVYDVPIPVPCVRGVRNGSGRMVVSVVRALSVGSARSGVRACRACWPVVGLGFAAGGQPNSETTGSAQPSGPLQDRSSLPPTATPPSFSLSLSPSTSRARSTR